MNTNRSNWSNGGNESKIKEDNEIKDNGTDFENIRGNKV